MRPLGERRANHKHPICKNLRWKQVKRLLQAGCCWCCEPAAYNDNAAKSRGRRQVRQDIEEQLEDDRAA